MLKENIWRKYIANITIKSFYITKILNNIYFEISTNKKDTYKALGLTC